MAGGDIGDGDDGRMVLAVQGDGPGVAVSGCYVWVVRWWLWCWVWGSGTGRACRVGEACDDVDVVRAWLGTEH